MSSWRKMRILKENYKEDKSIEKALVGLGNDFSLFGDVVVGFHKSIDYVVTGPSGVFAIKTKDDDGRVVCGRIWRRYKVVYQIGRHGRAEKEENISCVKNEIKHYAAELSRIIKDGGIKIKWVNGVVVFTNPNVKLEVNRLEAGIPVLKSEELCRFIRYEESKKVHPDDLRSIENIIKNIKI